MKSKILLTVVFIIFFSVCKSQDLIIKYRNIKNLEMEKLDVKALNKLREKLIKEDRSEEKIINEEGMQIKTLISYDNIYYTEQDEKKTLTISGNSQSGFTKRARELNSSIQHYSQFYPNGNLKLIGQESNEIKDSHTLNSQSFSMVGVWNYYDESGNIIEVREYDYEKPFLFTKKDVIAYIKTENLDDKEKTTVSISKLPSLIINGKVEKEGKWIIKIYYPEKLGVKTIVLNALTGEKLSETFGRIRR